MNQLNILRLYLQWGMGGRFREINRNGVNFLLTDLDLALTFMDISETTHSEETAQRNHNNGRKAYDTVLHLLDRLVPSPSERQAIDAKLAILKTRLQAVGQQF
jgi:hypothetical protein